MGLLLSAVVLGMPSAAQAAPDPLVPVLEVTTPVIDIQTSVTDAEAAVTVEESPRRVRLILDATVLFGKDSARLRPHGARRLELAATAVRDRGPGRVMIVGYTDDLGSAVHGLELSRRRARAVARVLRSELPSRSYAFTVVGKGEAEPAVPNISEVNRRINRRVVITYEPG